MPNPSPIFALTCSLVPVLAIACTIDDPNTNTTLIVLDTGDEDPSGDGDGDPPGDGDPTGDPTGGDGCSEALDILLVIDNSGSMGTVQRRLNLGISGLLDPLDAAGVDWRLGITTSDNGNPWCPPGTTTPEGGRLVLSPCNTRLGDFLYGNDVDIQDSACLDFCPSGQQVPLRATTTEVDPTPKQHPWLERIDGQTNLGDGVSMDQALACLVPQGVNGCGFESQLEAGYLALTRMQQNDQASYGFLRGSAGLLVLIISDEADCSYNKDWATIFAADGNRVFWSDPTSQFPTSAICWNAGVNCTGDPSNYTSCTAQDYDVDGAPTSDPGLAVLQPIARYIDAVEDLRAAKQALDPGAMVQFSVVGGVGLDGSVTYADSPDPNLQNSFGIGPGCEDADDSVVAVPPVRMREVSLDVGGFVGPICANSLEPVLAQIVAPFVESCG